MNTGVGSIIQPLTQSSKRKCGFNPCHQYRILFFAKRHWCGNGMKLGCWISLSHFLRRPCCYITHSSNERNRPTVLCRERGTTPDQVGTADPTANRCSEQRSCPNNWLS